MIRKRMARGVTAVRSEDGSWRMYNNKITVVTSSDEDGELLSIEDKKIGIKLMVEMDGLRDMLRFTRRQGHGR